MSSVLPVVPKAQPLMEGDREGQVLTCDLAHAEFFAVDEVLRERLGWEEREKAVELNAILVGILNCGEWLCGGFQGFDKPTMAEDMVKSLTTGIPKKQLIKIARKEGIFPRMLKLLLAREEK